MHDDPIAAALRRDAELLLEIAPAPDAARLWHAVRAARGRKIQRLINLCGWSLRGAIALAVLGVGSLAPHALASAAVPLLLIAWLTSGMCAPAQAPGAGS